MTYLIYLALGVFAGTLSGLFGIGGGLVIVPTLIFSFKLAGFPPELCMHMAIGTSLSTILITAINSVYAHQKHGSIDWKIVLKLALPIAIGTFIGGMTSSNLSAKTLELVFGIYVTVVATKMWMDVKVDSHQKITSTSLYTITGLIIGFKSAILGIGGGTISIPFLSWRGFPMKKAVGISASLGIPIALIGALTYIYNGQGVENLPANTLGYIYLPAFLGVILTSSIFARVGAKISQALPQDKMKKGFSIFLFVVAIKTIYTLFN